MTERLNTWEETVTKKELKDLNNESMQLYIKLWDDRFPDRKDQLKMFLLFYMQKTSL